ncbi:MAG: 2-polyprenyl-3-methyl-6-methoxy-1,4-benzoquinone monooxygenase [Proteobacteria bacterium]|nr:2-polyprenyl-3-methyl-6-methoxy-1,4-benzoquinone monooxygenase [Pseudomonadota bacterium]MDA1332209.1 2-polyprenyl-3-methyl-6-methoxy-1,4-benzoquinone monooxygenase [Pseudomonadota bacterium]
MFSFVDGVIEELDQSLRVLTGAVSAHRDLQVSESDVELNDQQKKMSAKFMRVNHTGEVCAQALYRGQAAVETNTDIKGELIQSAREELDHLVWTKQRIEELGGKTSVLNPLFYGGSFAIGMLAGLFGTQTSLGFLRETERQVESHLSEHLDRLPVEDVRSRVIISQMKQEERYHADRAQRLGASSLPKRVSVLMGLMSKIMTRTTFFV